MYWWTQMFLILLTLFVAYAFCANGERAGGKGSRSRRYQRMVDTADLEAANGSAKGAAASADYSDTQSEKVRRALALVERAKASVKAHRDAVNRLSVDEGRYRQQLEALVGQVQVKYAILLYSKLRVRVKIRRQQEERRLATAGVLKVTMRRAVGLRAADANGKSDPYVVVEAGGLTKQTRVVPKTLDPEWGEADSLEFPGDADGE